MIWKYFHIKILKFSTWHSKFHDWLNFVAKKRYRIALNWYKFAWVNYTAINNLIYVCSDNSAIRVNEKLTLDMQYATSSNYACQGGSNYGARSMPSHVMSSIGNVCIRRVLHINQSHEQWLLFLFRPLPRSVAARHILLNMCPQGVHCQYFRWTICRK